MLGLRFADVVWRFPLLDVSKLFQDLRDGIGVDFLPRRVSLREQPSDPEKRVVDGKLYHDSDPPSSSERGTRSDASSSVARGSRHALPKEAEQD